MGEADVDHGDMLWGGGIEEQWAGWDERQIQSIPVCRMLSWSSLLRKHSDCRAIAITDPTPLLQLTSPGFAGAALPYGNTACTTTTEVNTA